MRPPDLPGGNVDQLFVAERRPAASMRPPDLPGGNRMPLTFGATPEPELQ